MILKVILLIETGSDEFDNLEDYEYVDIEYDTYRWIRKRARRQRN